MAILVMSPWDYLNNIYSKPYLEFVPIAND
jgi:hypothetical protein